MKKYLILLLFLALLPGLNAANPPFSISDDLVEASLNHGEFMEKSILITNNRYTSDFEIINDEYRDFIFLREHAFRLKKNEEKSLEFIIFGLVNTTPDVYTGSILVKTNEGEKPIRFIVGISSLPFINISSTIPNKQNTVNKGGFVPLDVSISNPNEHPIEVDMEYIIKDLNNKKIYSEKEMLTVEEALQFTKRFKIYKNLEFGYDKYIIHVRARGNGDVVTSYDVFTVTEPALGEDASQLSSRKPAQDRNKPFILFLVFVFISILLIIIQLRKIKKMKRHRFSGKKIIKKRAKRLKRLRAK